MTDFDADLKRAFAAQDDPADEGFSAAVAARVVHRERRVVLFGALRTAAFGVAGCALALAIVSVVQAVGPGMMAQFGLDFANAYGAVAKGTPSVGAVQAALASMLTPLLLAGVAGVGGFALARTATDS